MFWLESNDLFSTIEIYYLRWTTIIYFLGRINWASELLCPAKEWITYFLKIQQEQNFIMTKVATVKKGPEEKSRKYITIPVIIAIAFVLPVLTLWGLIIAKATFFLTMLIILLLLIICFCICVLSKNEYVKYKRQYERHGWNKARIKFKCFDFIDNLIGILAISYIILMVFMLIITFCNKRNFFSSDIVYETIAEKSGGTMDFKSLRYLLADNSNRDKGQNFEAREDVSSDEPQRQANQIQSFEETEDFTENVVSESISSVDNGETTGSFSNSIPDVFDMDIDGSNDEEEQDSTVLILGPYDYSPLFLLGLYQFGDTITKEDMVNMQNMYDTFINNKTYMDMLNIPGKEYGEYGQIVQEIKEFDERQRSNKDLVSAEQYYRDFMNRCYCYGQNQNIQGMEQAAISAESAVEEEDISVSGSYNNYIRYTQAGVVSFYCVLDSGQSEYDSGLPADIKFRIGKLIYKPSANLLQINSGERYYSLCNAYCASQDAYKNSDSGCNYAVDAAYYHLKICSDLTDYIAAGEFRDEICREALGVYTEFRRRVEESDRAIYQEQEKDAEKVLAKIENLLGYNSQMHEEELEMPAP